MMREQNDAGTSCEEICMALKPGDRVFVSGETRPYRVRCRDERYIICTKPYNPKRTVMYFIIDLERKVRGPDNMAFCFGYETQEQCEERLQELRAGRMEVSYRRAVPLDCVSDHRK